jgi:hypothetical protein
LSLHLATGEAFSPQKRTSSTSKHEISEKFFFLLWAIFALLDPDLNSEYGSALTDLIESGSKLDRIRNIVEYVFNALVEPA